MQSYKISYINQKGNKAEIFFTDMAFESALNQAMSFIELNKNKLKMQLFCKNVSGLFNFGWKFMGNY